GIVLTNNHVVEGANEIQVKLFDDREFPGKVVGTDPQTDIAVVRIDTKDLRALPLGDSDATDVGDWVVAIGNPFGLAHTVSAGINTAIRGGGAQGIGFAIPINMVKQLLPMLLRDGHVTRSALGVRIVDAHQLSSDDRTALKLPEGARISGAVIEYVNPSGPADKAGL